MGLLDLFGFESLAHNSFEQLCINYANEKLQRQFEEATLTTQLEMYAREGVALSAAELTPPQNTAALALCDGAPPSSVGLWSLLNEESSLAQGTDANFVYKLLDACAASPALSRGRPNSKSRGAAPSIASSAASAESLSTAASAENLSDGAAGWVAVRAAVKAGAVGGGGELPFAIAHYADEVVYDGAGMLDKNRGIDAPDLELMMGASDLRLAAAIFATADGAAADDPPAAPVRARSRGSVASAKRSSVASQLRFQLEDLLALLSRAGCSYVRCLKPAASRRPRAWDGVAVARQLKAGGLGAVVAVAAAAYPTAMTHRQFCDRYLPLAPPDILDGGGGVAAPPDELGPPPTAEMDDRTRRPSDGVAFGPKGRSLRLLAYAAPSLASPADYASGKTCIFLRASATSLLETQRDAVRGAAAATLHAAARRKLLGARVLLRADLAKVQTALLDAEAHAETIAAAAADGAAAPPEAAAIDGATQRLEAALDGARRCWSSDLATTQGACSRSARQALAALQLHAAAAMMTLSELARLRNAAAAAAAEAATAAAAAAEADRRSAEAAAAAAAAAPAPAPAPVPAQRAQTAPAGPTPAPAPVPRRGSLGAPKKPKEPELRGWLWRVKYKANGGKLKRHFVILRGDKLLEFADEGGAKPKKVIALNACEVGVLPKENYPKRGCAELHQYSPFALHAAAWDAPEVFAAANKDEAAGWIERLRAAAIAAVPASRSGWLWVGEGQAMKAALEDGEEEDGRDRSWTAAEAAAAASAPPQRRWVMFSRGTLVCYSDEVGAVSKQAYEMAGARTRVPNALTDFQLDPTLKELSGKGLYPFSISWPDATDATGFGGGGGGRNLVLASSSLKDASTWLRVLSAAVGAPPPPLREGWLYKAGVVGGYKKRWFVLANGHELQYYEHPNDAEPKGVVPVADGEVFTPMQWGVDRAPQRARLPHKNMHCFCVRVRRELVTHDEELPAAAPPPRALPGERGRLRLEGATVEHASQDALGVGGRAAPRIRRPHGAVVGPRFLSAPATELTTLGEEEPTPPSTLQRSGGGGAGSSTGGLGAETTAEVVYLLAAENETEMRDWLHALQPLTEDERRARARAWSECMRQQRMVEASTRSEVGKLVGVLVQGGVGKESAPKAAGELWRAGFATAADLAAAPDELRRSGWGLADGTVAATLRATLGSLAPSELAALDEKRGVDEPPAQAAPPGDLPLELLGARRGSAPTQTALAHAFFDQLNSISSGATAVAGVQSQGAKYNSGDNFGSLKGIAHSFKP